MGLFQAQSAAQLRQIFCQCVNWHLQRIAVCFGQFSVVGKAVSGFVFRQDFVYLLDVGVHFIQQGFVFLGDWRAVQIYDFWKSLKSVWL